MVDFSGSYFDPSTYAAASDTSAPITFGSDGKMLGNLTGNSGQVPNSLPSLPSIGGFAPSQTATGAGVVASQGSIAGSAGTIASASAASAGAPATGAATAPVATGTGDSSSTIKDYFLRGVIIVLGFILVAVGLNMFRPGTIPNPVNAVRR